jgi:hypothetical protein
MELDDFLARMEHYTAVYQTLGEEHEGSLSFLKVVCLANSSYSSLCSSL